MWMHVDTPAHSPIGAGAGGADAGAGADAGEGAGADAHAHRDACTDLCLQAPNPIRYDL